MVLATMNVCSNLSRFIGRLSVQCTTRESAVFGRFYSTPTTPADKESATAEQQQPQVDPAEFAKVKEQNETLIENLKELDDKYKRALADAENMRVRLTKQIDDSKIFGIQKFCKDLLEVADVLQTACGAVPEEEAAKNTHLKNLFQGLQMTEAQLQSVFRRHGLTQINPLGDKFDPNEHEAVFMAEDKSKEVNTVAVVSKLGYKLKDRVIRPAAVGVVKH